MGGGYNKPKTQIKKMITPQERLEAEEALRSLKQKMANVPKKPIKQKVGIGGGSNQNKMMNNKMNYGMDFNMDNFNYGYGGGDNNFNNPPPKKPISKTTIAKKPMPMGNNSKLRAGVGMKMNNQFGGGFGSGGGFVDNRPLGGGLTADQMPNENEITTPCPHCGRKFNEISYPKHVQNCQKVFQKKRKAFNTQKQRIVDSEQASLMKQGALLAKKNPKLNKKKGDIPKWKLQSMEFRAICNPGKANKMGFGGMGVKMGGIGMNNMNAMGSLRTGKPMNKGKGGIGGSAYGGGGYGMDMGGGMDIMGMKGYMPSAIPMDYTHCQYCNRNYNEEAYNKHLNGCKRRYEEAQMRNKMSKKPSGKAPIKSSYGKGQINYPSYNSSKIGKKK
jgi:hypothetical protein